MRILLAVTAAIEAAAGLALAASPSAMVAMLLGSPLDTPAGLTIARVAGAALLSLGVACWRARREERGRAASRPDRGHVTLQCGRGGDPGPREPGRRLFGIGLWPGLILHAGMAVWCARMLLPAGYGLARVSLGVIDTQGQGQSRWRTTARQGAGASNEWTAYVLRSRPRYQPDTPILMFARFWAVITLRSGIPFGSPIAGRGRLRPRPDWIGAVPDPMPHMREPLWTRPDRPCDIQRAQNSGGEDPRSAIIVIRRGDRRAFADPAGRGRAGRLGRVLGQSSSRLFVIRITDGVPRAARGQVTRGFLRDVAETCADNGVRGGEIRGIATGRRINLAFSGSIPNLCRQQIRNIWGMSGWSAAGPPGPRADGLAGGTMRRHSIRTLMAFIVVSAIGLAALRRADEFWAGMLLMAALAAVGAAVLGAAILQGRERAWWAGFAFFGGGYLARHLRPLAERFVRASARHDASAQPCSRPNESAQALAKAEIAALDAQRKDQSTQLQNMRGSPEASATRQFSRRRSGWPNSSGSLPPPRRY